MKTSITLRLTLTLSKIMGVFGVLAGCYGFVIDKDPGQSVMLAALGYAAIGVKQYFNSKSFNNPTND